MPDSLAMVRARQIRSLGDIPPTVISAGDFRRARDLGGGCRANEGGGGRAAHRDGLAVSEGEARDCRGERTPRAEVSQPGLVVDAIREVVEAAELKLMLKGQSLLWFAGALGLNVACLLVPVDRALHYVSLVVWVWPLAVWSQMGVRERRFNTEQMVFAVPRPSLRRLPALWLAGVLVAVLAGSGAWLRLALMGETASVLAWFVGTLFVPALALGVWVGNSRAFEAV